MGSETLWVGLGLPGDSEAHSGPRKRRLGGNSAGNEAVNVDKLPSHYSRAFPPLLGEARRDATRETLLRPLLLLKGEFSGAPLAPCLALKRRALCVFPLSFHIRELQTVAHLAMASGHFLKPSGPIVSGQVVMDTSPGFCEPRGLHLPVG